MKERTSPYPGIHPNFPLQNFSKDIQCIVNTLKREFFITSGSKIQVGASSEYEYILVEPTDEYRETFNLQKEIVILFSKYQTLQARTLDVFERINKTYSTLRLEKICGVLISNDPKIEHSLLNLTKSEPESQIIIPFIYSEFKGKVEVNFFINRFKKYLYDRDLFAFEAPLKKDLYFFGRNDLILTIIDRYKRGENSGLFGLRKTGKTSVIYGIERSLSRDGIVPVVIDCQNPSFNQKRWFQALYFICKETKARLKLNQVRLALENEFNEQNAASYTKTFFQRCKDSNQNDWPLFFIFDEIENISLKTSPCEHWSQGTDFIPFWQALRSIFEKNNNLISYLVVGTNPSCIEVPTIGNIDNPLFNHFTPLYIPGFQLNDTEDMVKKLGRPMGLKFEDTIYAKLTEDFGGHPFLIRHLCSFIHKEVHNRHKTVTVDKKLYQTAKTEFIKKFSNYLEMILLVVMKFYPDEYEMLIYLAKNEISTFNEMAEYHPSYTSHLIGYSLIKKGISGYDFQIDSVKEYLLMQNKYKRIGLTTEEKWEEISARRNRAEIKLRKIVKMQLRANTKNIDEAKQVMLDIFGGKRQYELSHLGYNDIFDPNKGEIYFLDLAKVISKKWEMFENIFSHSKKGTFEKLEFINKSRADAHAKDITEELFQYFRICMSDIEKDLEDLM
ncbi:MAG: AAA-like domain-containing protein [Nostoc sp. DedVER02]|uniref:AAA-like domain-containing protein n=1 Tax=unclassified Nostoc TaxID=2593658 RepID=UPI002AD2590B|nr:MULTISPECIES: AAA-like domain-containing protein [unclassified Nostoc]MDZ7987347.1 AAA-like domain-containing protein [Nostoc sp. DedVER02]MDZ8116054.1 AAA-like domain-containing protein [Nostoc sp. DedVER01b]